MFGRDREETFLKVEIRVGIPRITRVPKVFFFRGGIGRALQVEAVAYAKAWRFAKGKWKPGRPK